MIKIMQVEPINFNLKTQMEKEGILNSYKIFLKTCNFDMQILIQSKKEDLCPNINFLEENIKKEKNEDIHELAQEYILYLKELNQKKSSSSKNYFILIKKSQEKKSDMTIHEIPFHELRESYIKIKDSLAKCGNSVREIEDKETVEKILISFFNKRIEKTENEKR